MTPTSEPFSTPEPGIGEDPPLSTTDATDGHNGTPGDVGAAGQPAYARVAGYGRERIQAARTSPRLAKAQERVRTAGQNVRSPQTTTPVSTHAKVVASELKAKSKVANVKVVYVHPKDILDIIKSRLAARKSEMAQQHKVDALTDDSTAAGPSSYPV